MRMSISFHIKQKAKAHKVKVKAAHKVEVKKTQKQHELKTTGLENVNGECCPGVLSSFFFFLRRS